MKRTSTLLLFGFAFIAFAAQKTHASPYSVSGTSEAPWSTISNWTNNLRPESGIGAPVIVDNSSNTLMDIENYSIGSLQQGQGTTLKLSHDLSIHSLSGGTATGNTLNLNSKTLVIDLGRASGTFAYEGGISGGTLRIIGSPDSPTNPSPTVLQQFTDGSFNSATLEAQGGHVSFGGGDSNYNITGSTLTASGTGYVKLTAVLSGTTLKVKDSGRIKVATPSQVTGGSIIVESGIFENHSSSYNLSSNRTTITQSGGIIYNGFDLDSKNFLSSNLRKVDISVTGSAKFYSANDVTDATITVNAGEFYNGLVRYGTTEQRSNQIADAEVTSLTVENSGFFHNLGNYTMTAVGTSADPAIKIVGTGVYEPTDGSIFWNGPLATLKGNDVNNFSVITIENYGRLVNLGSVQVANIIVKENGIYLASRVGTQSLVNMTVQAGGYFGHLGEHDFSSVTFETASGKETVYGIGLSDSPVGDRVHAAIDASGGTIAFGTGTVIQPYPFAEFYVQDNKHKFIWRETSPAGEEYTIAKVGAANNLTFGGDTTLDAGDLVIDDQYFANDLFESTFSLRKDGTDLKMKLVMTRKASYAELAKNSYFKPVARALDIARTSSPSPELQKLLTALDQSVTATNLSRSIRKLTPEQYNSAQFTARRNANAAVTQFTSYMNSRRFALKGTPYRLTIDPATNGLAYTNGANRDVVAQALPFTPGERQDREIGPDKMVNIFARATTGYTRVGHGATRIGLRSSRVGAVFGIDVRLHENIVLGFAGSYDYNDIDFSRNLGSGRVNSYRFGPYAMIYNNNWFFETELTIGLYDNKFNRRVEAGGTVYKPTANYDSIDFVANIGVGYDFDLAGFMITPRANLQYQYYRSDSFTEKDGGAANQRVSKYDTSSLISRIGVDLWKRFDIDQPYLQSATPFFTVGWRHEWIAPTDLTAQFEGGGSSFNIDNDLFSRNAIYLGIGSSLQVNEQFDIDLRYQADLGDRKNISQNASINLRFKF